MHTSCDILCLCIIYSFSQERKTERLNSIMAIYIKQPYAKFLSSLALPFVDLLKYYSTNGSIYLELIGGNPPNFNFPPKILHFKTFAANAV